MIGDAGIHHDELPESYFQAQQPSPFALSQASGMGVLRVSGPCAGGWVVSPWYYGVESLVLGQIPVLLGSEQSPAASHRHVC
jgi:hypothetical protein